MAWVYLDDQFPDHPKVALAGGDAGWLFICGLAYVKRYNTEGLIPKAQVSKLSDRKNPTRLARRLVEVGLWEDGGEHYVVHDYGDWNKPQASRSAAGRKAAQARWARDSDAKRNANAYADASESHSNGSSESHANSDASECPPPPPYPPGDLPPPTTNAMAVDNPVDGDEEFIMQAVNLAANRYARNQVDKGKADNADGLARWWMQENAVGASQRAQRLVKSHDLSLTQLADALVAGNPSWLNSYRRRTPA